MKGVFLGLKYVLARMMPRGEGAIVNTASTSAIRGRAGLAGYVASKHAVLGLTRTAALEVAGARIRVNAVLPGPVEVADDPGAGRAGAPRSGRPAPGGRGALTVGPKTSPTSWHSWRPTGRACQRRGAGSWMPG